MDTITRPVRIATPERWQKALRRALDSGVEIRQLSGSGQWIVASASRPGMAYETDGVDCTCEAAMLGGDPVCLHRALFHYSQGTLDLEPEPDPPAPAAPAERIWSQRDERLLQIAIGNEVVNRCAKAGRRWTDLSADELRQLRYQIYLDFTTGKTAGEARAKKANMYRMLDVGRVPVLAQTTPFATPDLAPAA